MKILRLVLALALVVTLMTFASAAFASPATTAIDQKAELTLLSKGTAMGTAELRLKIDEAGMLQLFRIKVDADGLVPGGTYTLWKGMHLVATGIADNNGKLSFDEELSMFSKTTLVGVTVKVVYGTTLMDPVVLWGKVMESDIIEEGSILTK